MGGAGLELRRGLEVLRWRDRVLRASMRAAKRATSSLSCCTSEGVEEAGGGSGRASDTAAIVGVATSKTLSAMCPGSWRHQPRQVPSLHLLVTSGGKAHVGMC